MHAYCVYKCEFVPFHRKGFLLTEQRNKCNARVQVSDGIQWKYICIWYLCLRVKGNHQIKLQAVKKSVD